MRAGARRSLAPAVAPEEHLHRRRSRPDGLRAAAAFVPWPARGCVLHADRPTGEGSTHPSPRWTAFRGSAGVPCFSCDETAIGDVEDTVSPLRETQIVGHHDE